MNYHNTYKEFIIAFSIFDKYDPDATWVLIPEHDQIYSGHNLEISDEDKEELEYLGWDYDENLNCWIKNA